MYGLRKINLYLENELPVKKILMTGGGINMDLIDNKTHKYIRSDNKITTFIYGTPKIEEDVQLWFEFNNEYMILDENNPNLYYIERVNNSITFNITQLKQYSNVIVKDMPRQELTLKLIDLTYKDIDSFMEEWKYQESILKSSIPNIYMYGELYTKDNKFISYYYITKKYKNHMALLKLDYNYTIQYIIKMLLFLQLCIENNLILRNFKFSGLGFEFINSEINFVFLDYNDTSIIKSSDNYFRTFTDGCDAMCAGTLIPYFVISDFFEMNTNWIEKLDKLYIVGLAETLIFLLYNQNEIMEKLFKMLYDPSYLKPCLHYYHYMKIFDNKNNKKTFMDLFNSLIPKFVEMDSKFINPMFRRIIVNCFETTYNTIKSPVTYLNTLKETINNFNQFKASIKTHIKPINVDVSKSIHLPLPNTSDEQKETETTEEYTELPEATEQLEGRGQLEQDNVEESDLKELERMVETDEVIGSGLFPVKPYTQRPKNEIIKPILKQSDFLPKQHIVSKPILTQSVVLPKQHKKVGFIDTNY